MEIKKPRLHLLAARLPVMPVTSSILSTAERGGWRAAAASKEFSHFPTLQLSPPQPRLRVRRRRRQRCR